MMTVKEYRTERDREIYLAYRAGKSHKLIAAEHGLSPSRVKAICAEQRVK